MSPDQGLDQLRARVRAAAADVRRDRFAVFLVVLCLPLAAWWVAILATPGWERSTGMPPGEVALPMLIWGLLSFAVFTAREWS